MKFLNKPNDNYFYFFAIYSGLFLVFRSFDLLVLFQYISYIWLLVFFLQRLYSYFSFVRTHKSRIEKIADTDWKNKLTALVQEAEENFREWVIIFLLTFCFFFALQTFWKNSYVDTLPQPAWADMIEQWNAELLELEQKKIQSLTEKRMSQEQEIISATGSIKAEDIVAEYKQAAQLNDSENSPENDTPKTPVQPKEISGNITKENTASSLSLQKNFNVQVKDIYTLTPFTKYWSDFFNILQLQRVLNKLGYYSWVADGTFNFETKLAIYNTLVSECNWPKASTKWVFWPKAKECIDNLYISVGEEETNWIVE